MFKQFLSIAFGACLLFLSSIVSAEDVTVLQLRMEENSFAPQEGVLRIV